MGAEFGLALMLPGYFKDLFISIEKIKEGKKILNSEDIRDIISYLVKFMSDEYIYLKLIGEENKSKKPEKSGKGNDVHYLIKFMFLILENFEKFLSIKCLFPLIEELKKSKFEDRINELKLLLKNENEKKRIENKFIEESKNFGEEFYLKEDIQKIIAKFNNNHDNDGFIILVVQFIFDYLFESEIEGNHKINKKEPTEKFLKELKEGISSISLIKNIFEKKELSQLLNDLLSFDYPLKYTNETNEIYQLFIAALNIIILAYNDSEIEYI